MDRTIVYPGAIPLETDLLSAQRSAMVALGYLAQATVGSATVVDGLACSAAVGSLGVVVGPGSIFQLTVTDQNAYSSLAADSDPLVKVGINTSSTTFGLTAPTVSALSLTACASPPPVTHLPVPASLLACAAEPAAPAMSTDAGLADWILDLRSAGADCRSKLHAVAGIVAGR